MPWPPLLTLPLRKVMFLTLPVTTAAAERSFGKLKLMMNYLKSQMDQGRLDGLAVVNIESDKAD